MVFNNKNIVKYIKITPMLSIIILMTAVIGISLYMQNKNLKKELAKIENIHIQHHKELLVNFADQVQTVIKSFPKDREQAFKILSLMRVEKEVPLYIFNLMGEPLINKKKFLKEDGVYFQKGYRLVKQRNEIFLEKDIFATNGRISYFRALKESGMIIAVSSSLKDNKMILEEQKRFIQESYNHLNYTIVLISIIIVFLVILLSILLSKKIEHIIKEAREKTYNQHKVLAQIIKDKTSCLRRNLGFTNQLINTIPLPIFVKDQNLRYIDCNNAFCEFVGKNKKEIIGKTFKELNVFPQLASFKEEKDRYLIEHTNKWFQSYKYMLNQGDITVLEFYEAKFIYKKELNAFLGVIVDITDKEMHAKSLQEEVTAKTIQNLNQTRYYEQEQLKNIKFTAIGQLAAGITHEINTPLTYILGNFEMMRYDIDALPDDEIKQRMQEDALKIQDGLHRIANIVESMREVSQKSKEEKEMVNIYHTLITSLTMAYNRSKQITPIMINNTIFDLDHNKDEHIFISFVQKQRIEQVWIVIINNALDELVKVGTYEKRKLLITIDYNKDKSEIIVKFKDNAGGISSNIIDHIFDPFISSKEHGGMGIGLNVAKRIIEEQKGGIIAYNEDGGAVFEVKLPLQGEEV